MTGELNNKSEKSPARFRILSIDGGGIRGIIPGQVLVNLERILQDRSGKPGARIADFFDLFAGTSTGGILACTYLVPEVDKATPRFTAQQAVDLYLEHGDEVFDLTIWQRIISVGGIADEKYSAVGLEAALNNYFGNTKLSDLLKPCLITAYDIQRRQAFFFRQHRARQSEGANFFVRDVARATSAAPTYFEPARVKSNSGVFYPLVDGGLFANNPALCAYAEARNWPEAYTAKDMMILSLGTGQDDRAYDFDRARNWGAVAWVKPVIDIMMSGVSDVTDYHLRQIYDAVGRSDQYLRIAPTLGNASPALDNASPENLAALRQAGQYAAEQHYDELTDFVDKLLSMDHSNNQPA